MSELTFETDEKLAIHRAACEMVSASAAGEPIQVTDPTMARAASKEVSGAFVTLKRDGKLRSCYGCYGGKSALFQALQSASIGTATKDPRFSVVQPAELEQLHLEVSILFDIQRVKSVAHDRAREIEIGTHGLTIQHRGKSGLLLPRVAIDLKLNAEGFLRQTSLKAGLPETSWMDDESILQRFQVCCFGAMFAK